MLEQSEIHDGSGADPLQDDTDQTAGGWSWRQALRARTVHPPPPRTVEQPQACSVNESFMAAPVQTKLQASRWSWWQAISARVPAAETSMHLACATTSCCGAAASLLVQLVDHGGSGADQTAGGWSWRQALFTRVLAAKTSTHLASATASHCRAAASLLDQSELHGGSGADQTAGVWSWWQALFTRVPAAVTDEHAPCIRHRLAPTCSSPLARSTSCSWWLWCRPQCRRLIVAASTLPTSAGGRDEHAPCMRHRPVL